MRHFIKITALIHQQHNNNEKTINKLVFVFLISQILHRHAARTGQKWPNMFSERFSKFGVAFEPKMVKKPTKIILLA